MIVFAWKDPPQTINFRKQTAFFSSIYQYLTYPHLLHKYYTTRHKKTKICYKSYLIFV